MAETETETKKAEKGEAPKITLLRAFLSRSGYETEDVLVYSSERRLFVTSNGGKYHLAKNGTIRILKGPDYPKLVEELAEA